MSERLSILQLCAVDFTARRFLLPLMRAQREAGFDVELACAPGPDIEVVAREGFVHHSIPFRRSMNIPAHIKAYRALAALLRRRPFTIVHAHTPIASAIARPCARRNGVPLVIYTAHGFYFHERMRPIVRFAHVTLEKIAQRYADYLFTQSAEDCETAIAEGIAPRGRAETIGNGVDTRRFFPEQFSKEQLDEARRELAIRGDDHPIVVMIGRLVREKGYFEFLEAMAALRQKHPKARALIVGSALTSDHDDAAHGIRAHATQLGLGDGAIFAGLRSDVPRLLALGDVFCLPSWREGMPRSIIEAMAAGLPVVATDIRGSREEVVEGETGLIVPVRDAAGLGQALIKMADDPAKARRMGEAGRRRAVEQFDEQRVIERQMVRIHALLREKGIA